MKSRFTILAAYLLEKFKDRPVTFLLQNWEGDWMLRGSSKEQWAKGEYPDLDKRSAAFIRWLQARQRGVERARAENPTSKCKVLHAVEVNQVLPTWKGIPTLTSQSPAPRQNRSGCLVLLRRHA